jgi:hypothetical protein
MDEKKIDFSMSMEMMREKFIKMNFDINNASFEKLNVMWPVFLNQLDIRDWVIEHFKSGDITNAFAHMNFNYLNGKFKLEKIDAEVKFTNTNVDYSDLFPKLSNVDAKAIFTIDDMNIYINSANIEKTKLTNGKIYTNFDDKRPSLDIYTKSNGKVYEMFYFINNNQKEQIKSIVENYMNGQASSDIRVNIPLINDLSFNDCMIKINSNVKNNDTFLLSNNSLVKLNVIKNLNSTIFKVNIDLKESLLDFRVIDFIKKKNENLSLELSINVLDDEILLSNIIPKNSNMISFEGNGIINDGVLKKLHIDNIRYKNNSFDFEYSNDEEISVSVFGEQLNLNIDEKTTVNKENEIKDKINFKISLNNLIFNQKYNFEITEVSGSYDGYLDNTNITIGEKKNIIINILKSKDRDGKYIINAQSNNFGEIINKLSISDKIVGGEAYFNGIIKKNNDFGGTIKLKNNFSIITGEFKNKNFFKYIIDNELLNKSLRKDLQKYDTISFKRAGAEIYFSKNILTVKNLAFESNKILGIGISGKGEYYLNKDRLEFNGLITPLDKINTLFGANKIPLINKIFFDNKNSGLFTVAYTVNKNNGEYSYKIIPTSVINANSVKNFFLMFIFLL